MKAQNSNSTIRLDNIFVKPIDKYEENKIKQSVFVNINNY